jgi:hypothetical protein
VAEVQVAVQRECKPSTPIIEPAGCTCGAFVQWQIHPTSGDWFCDPCGRWQGWEELEPQKLPASSRCYNCNRHVKWVKHPKGFVCNPCGAFRARAGDIELPESDRRDPHGAIIPHDAWSHSEESALKRAEKADRAQVRRAAKKDARWWASDEWKRSFGEREMNAYRVRGGEEPSIVEPAPAEWTMAMSIETGVGRQGSNGAMHAHAGRQKKRKTDAYNHTLANAKRFVGWPVIVTLTRVSPVQFDKDNLGTAFKSVRDGIATGLGFKDDRERPGVLDWQCRQEPGGSRKSAKGPAYHEVKVRIEVMR